MTEQTRVLVGIAVMVLLEHSRSRNNIQRRNVCAPALIRSLAQPLEVLGNHRVDDAKECFIAGEETVTACQYIAFQQTFRLMLG
ncbi:hypothetical protein D3C71_1862910 [compost metagenome]